MGHLQKNKAWVVAVDMGYGHLRAAHPLKHLSPTGKIINANSYEDISARDERLWRTFRSAYEFFSRLNSIPVIGPSLFGIMDKFQELTPFYPRRDLSAPNLQVRQTYGLIHGGLCRQLIEMLNREDIPLVTTFFSVAFAAEEYNFKNEIYLVVCDTDISRTWAPLNPAKSRIKYLAPTRRSVARLKLYGVPAKNIFLTGFPLPEENIGGPKLKVLKKDLAERVINLDPEKHYRMKYSSTVRQFLTEQAVEEQHHHPLTLTFAVGGAGAQRGIGSAIIKSLKKKLVNEEIKLNLVAGSREDVFRFFTAEFAAAKLTKHLNRNIRIIYNPQKEAYFDEFNAALRKTDILWTKPSELSFYTALGLPIIIAPPLGSQEVFNSTWLKTVGGGIDQEDPRYTHEWLFDWVNSGWLAEAGMSGFLDERQFGVQNITDVVFNGSRKTNMDNDLM
jgi:hypothetical protein